MPEPVSTVAATLVCGGLYLLLKENSGVSQESRALEHAATRFVTKSRDALSVHPEKNALISRLWEMAGECGEPDWNGYEAAPLKPAAVSQADKFIQAWPLESDLPDASPEPDGSVNLEWIYSRNRRVTVSLDGNPRMAFAWLDGAGKGRGIAVFQNGLIPRELINAVRGVRGH